MFWGTALKDSKHYKTQ
jgi:hypothetical protein